MVHSAGLCKLLDLSMSCSKGGKGAHIQPRAISRCQFFTCKLGGCPCSCPSAGAMSLTLFPSQYPWICLCETGLGYGEHRSLLSFEEEIPAIGLKEIHGEISSLGCLNVPLVSILAAPVWHFLNPVLAIEAIILGLSICQDTEAAHTLNKKIRIKKNQNKNKTQTNEKLKKIKGQNSNGKTGCVNLCFTSGFSHHIPKWGFLKLGKVILIYPPLLVLKMRLTEHHPIIEFFRSTS